MPHNAFSLVDVIYPLDDKISCITYNGDLVYLGTASGKLLVYRVSSKTTASGKVEYSSERIGAPVEVTGGKKAVSQVEAIPDLNLLLVLADGGMHLFDLEPFKKRTAGILDSKNVQSFAINVRGPPKYKLCVSVGTATKRRLRLYEWDNGKYAYIKELDLPSGPQVITYIGSRLFLGYSKEYNICLDDTGEVQDLPAAVGSDTRPYIKVLPGDKVLIIVADDLALSVDPSGSVTIDAPLKFAHHPLALAYCYPYVLSINEGSTKMEVHAVRGSKGTATGRDEVVQLIDVPLNAVGIADGRIGYNFRAGSSFEDSAKGRNPVYVAFSAPGRVCRLQPVPVDRQVEEMLRNYQVAAALELLANTCNDPVLYATKKNRLHIDAGRVLFYSLHFEAAFHHLTQSNIDPRELIRIFPELLISAAAVTKSLSPEASAGSVPPTSLVRAFDYKPRYFTASLTEGIANGKSPAGAANEAADAMHIATPSINDFSALLSASEDGTSGALEPGVRTGASEIRAIVKAQLAGYTSRNSDASFPRLEGGAALPPAKLAAMASEDERVNAAYEGLVRFLRSRRNVVQKTLKGEIVAPTAVPADADFVGVAGAGSVAPSSPVSSAAATPVEFDVTSWSVEDIEALALALDTALLKAFHKTGRWRHIDRLVFKSPYLDLTDAAAFLTATGRHHSVALLYHGRGMIRQALTVWRDLGLGKLEEMKVALGRARSPAEDTFPQPRMRADSISDNEAETFGAVLVPVTSLRRVDEGSEGAGAALAHASPAVKFPPALFQAPPSKEVLDVVAQRYDGVDDSIELLRREDDIEIIKEFAEWLLVRHSGKALAVFTGRQVELPPDVVLDYFSSEALSIAAKRNPAAAPTRLYLEHLVFNLGYEEDRYHTQLAREYIGSVDQLRGTEAVVKSAVLPKSSAAKSLNPDDPVDREAVLAGTSLERPWPGSEGGTLGELRGKLIRLLQESGFYDSSAILALIRGTTLYEEQVIVHARVGEHEKALSILVNLLADHEQAIRYCLLISKQRFGEGRWSMPDTTVNGAQAPVASPAVARPPAHSTSSGEVDPFILLVGLYLEADKRYHAEQQALGTRSASTKMSIFLDRALDVLSKHADRIDPLSVAQLLPDALPLHQLLSYWEVVVPASAHSAREAAVVRHLYRDTNIQVHYNLVERQSRNLEMTRTTFCFVCDKRIIDSVFSVLPDNRAIHFGCLRELGNTYGAALSQTDPDVGAKKLGFHASSTRSRHYSPLSDTGASDALSIYPGSSRPALRPMLGGYQYTQAASQRPSITDPRKVDKRTDKTPQPLKQLVVTKQIRFNAGGSSGRVQPAASKLAALGSVVSSIAHAPVAMVGLAGDALGSMASATLSAADYGVKALHATGDRLASVVMPDRSSQKVGDDISRQSSSASRK